MNINISGIVNNKIKEMEENETVEKLIEENVENIISKAIIDALGGYKVKMQIEDNIEKEVSETIRTIGFEGYNKFIAEKFKQITDGVLQEDIQNKVSKTMDNIFFKKVDSIKLSEIFDKYREYLCDSLEYYEKDDLNDEFFLSIKEHDEYGWLDITLNRETPSSSIYSCRNDVEASFTIHRKHRDKENGYISSVRLEGIDVKENMKFNVNEFEALLCNLSYNDTNIEIDVEDEDDIDTTLDLDY